MDVLRAARKQLNEDSDTLTAYECSVREASLARLEAACVPARKSFGFKRKAPAATPRAAVPSDAPAEPVPQAVITDQIIRPRHQDNLVLQGYAYCVLDLSHLEPVTVAHLRNIHHCLVLLPPIRQSLLADDCSNCVIHGFLCAQMRLHNCNSNDVHLQSETDPILENSTQQAFGGGRTPINFDDPLNDGAVLQYNTGFNLFYPSSPTELRPYLVKLLPERSSPA
jgi:hypothetical protein